MIDGITVAIELVGIAILLTWIVIPIREFRQILRAVKNKAHPPTNAAQNPRGEDGKRA